MATTVTLKPNAIDISGSTSGTTTLQATAVAGTTTLTLPAATDTLVGKATTDTLTNKTLTGAVMNGTLGATTPSTVAATTLTTSSTVTHNGGTANGVGYLDGSKVLTTGSALVFDGTNLGLGVTPSAWNTIKPIEIARAGSFVGANSSGSTYLGANTRFASNWIYANNGPSGLYTIEDNTHFWRTAPSGTAGNTITFTQAMTLTSGGVFLVRATSVNGSHVNANLLRSAETTDGSGVLIIESSNATNGTTAFFGVAGAGVGYNGSVCAFGIYRCSTNSRSINAAGSINASGADYAEYMTKAGDFAIAKGDVVGIDAQGRLTNVFANAISFAVKSTDPAYVGGDVWGSEEAIGATKPEKPSQRQSTEEAEAETDEEFASRLAQYEADKTVFDAALEAARQRVDRIAFAGQVPVNVVGATAGQYIIPVNNNGAIKGEAVSNPTFEQYQTAVGKVIAIESDGRAKIIVKVA